MPLAVLACALSAAGLAACSSSNPAVSTPSGSSSSSAVLVTEGSPSGPISKDFNPFTTTSASSILGFTYMINEPLMQFNLLKPGVDYPWLATSYKWGNKGKQITFTLRSGVKFTNGEAFNASEAAWEYNLLKKYPAINLNGLPIASATAPDPTTLVINFTSPVYTDLYYIAGQVPMVPENVWSKVGNPATYANTSPVGTGPYEMSSSSSSGAFLTRNTSYWQGAPAVKTVEFPAYDSNTSANLALEQGQLDWAGNFVQNIKADFVDKNPSTNHYWDAPLQTETLIPNLTEFPFNGGAAGLAVREAISYGVNRQEVSNVGEDTQQPAVQGPGSLTGITLPLDKSYVTPATAGYVATYDPAKAKQVLEAAGWKMGSNGIFQLNGKPLAFSIEDPTPYTDFITDDQIMAQELKQVGMDVTV
ncbi:MAG: ABC transporter substrate-binding protein, partial [Trebonia sp.]